MLFLFRRLIRPFPLVTLLCWCALSVGFALSGYLAGARTSLPGPTNIQSLLENAGERRAIEAGIPPVDTLMILLSHPRITVEDSPFVHEKEALVRLLHKLLAPDGTKLFRRVETAGHTLLGHELFIAQDHHAYLIRAETRLPVYDSDTLLRTFPAILEQWIRERPEFTVGYLSNGTFNNEMFELIHKDLDRSLIYTVPLTFAILVVAFGSVIAAIIPLLVATLSLAAALGIAALISQQVGPISATASQLVVLLVLAVGIDYALFFISRVREERRVGGLPAATVERAFSATASAILWSGGIVAVSLCGLFLMQDSILASMAIVSAVAVIFTGISSILVTPCILLLLGDRLEWGSVRIRRTSSSTAKKRHSSLQFALAHPLATTVSGFILLLLIGSLTFSLKLGSTIEPGLMPTSLQSHKAFTAIRKGFPVYDGVDLSLVIWGDRLRTHEESDEFQAFFDGLAERDNLSGPLAVEWSNDESVARFHFIAAGSANEPTNRELVQWIRSELIPATLERREVNAALSGTLPFVVDNLERYTGRTPLVCGAVLGISFLFLLVAFRSIVIPLKAIVLNLLSTMTAFGALVLVFDWLSVGGLSTPIIESFVPALLFAILFGLSMDYHVFLLARITEEYARTPSVSLAVREGVERTYSTITSAALIMIAVFLVIATLELPIMRQLGLGLATAVLVDVTIVRALLLPSTMIMLNRANWYLPRWLRWLPNWRPH